MMLMKQFSSNMKSINGKILNKIRPLELGEDFKRSQNL